MTLSDLIAVMNKDHYVCIWLDDNAIGCDSIDSLLKHKVINNLLDYKVIKVYAVDDELHIYVNCH